jgi:outer membrane protein, multidrug efflux system
MNSLRLAPLCLLISCLLSSCVVGPDHVKPETPVDPQFAEKKQGNYSSEKTVVEWWRKFGDPQLISLVERSLINNKDLKIAAARVEEARSLRRLVRYDYFPTVTSDAAYTQTRRSISQVGGSESSLAPAGFSSTRSRTQESYEVNLDATWELDIWGRVRRSNFAARFDVVEQEALRHDTMVIIAAETARTYLELRGLQNELEVARRNAQNQRDTLKLTESLLQGGRGTELDTSRARAQLNSTLAAIPTIESFILRDIHRISVLTGEQPDMLTRQLIKAKGMPALPSLVRIGNPADLLRRRPDIRAAEAQLGAATQRIGIATADLFPRVTFNGRVGLEADKLSGLTKSGADTYSFGPSITWAAFDLGRVYSNIEINKARTRQQLANYEKTVLIALQETEDALVDFGKQRQRREFLREAATASAQAAKLARERYQTGVATFLEVLDAERVMLEAESRLAESETLTATAQVAIYKALGGGWETNGVSRSK